MRRPVETEEPVRALSASQALLERMADNWHLRAQVRRKPPQEELAFELSRPDFSVELLPFKDHPRFLRFNEQELSTILSSAWLAYNHKTLDIEMCVVSPLCHDVLAGRLAGLASGLSQQIISETLVDESFHVLLTVNATNRTRHMRNLDVDIPPSFLLRAAQSFQAQHTEEWQRSLIRFAVAVVSEVFISDYLLQLSSSDTIQPLHRLVVDTHRRDEAAHGVIFRHLAKVMYASLTEREREFFASVLPKPVGWFAARDLEVWSSIFQQLGTQDTYELIHDCKKLHSGNLSHIDYTGVVSLAREMGITDMPIGREAFESEGLLA